MGEKEINFITREEIPDLVKELKEQFPEDFFDDSIKALVPIHENVKVEIYLNSDISMSIEELSKQGINPITKDPDNVKRKMDRSR